MIEFFVGIDPSLTGTGIILIDKDKEIHKQELVKTKPSMEIEERLHVIMNELVFITGIIKPHIYIEGLSYGSMSQRMFQLAGLHYYIRTTLFLNKTKFSIIPPTTLKKWLTGKGNSKKELMILNCYKKFGVSFNDNNLCDAYCLARMALADYEEQNNVKE